MSEDGVAIEASGRQFLLTHPEKVFFPERGETKLDLVGFYEAVADPLLAAMGGRPVLLQRFPHGAGGSSFFHGSSWYQWPQSGAQGPSSW